MAKDVKFNIKLTIDGKTQVRLAVKVRQGSVIIFVFYLVAFFQPTPVESDEGATDKHADKSKRVAGCREKQ